MSLLITGGSGYVGSQLISKLLTNEIFDKIIVLDQFEPPKSLSDLSDFKKRVSYVHGNTSDYESILESIKDWQN